MSPKYSVERDSETQELTERYVLAEWGHDTHFHATGDRTAIHRRIVVKPGRDGFASVLMQERREMTLGPEARRERREHDWRTVEAVDLSPSGSTVTDYTRGAN
jgi:hypothetical protein